MQYSQASEVRLPEDVLRKFVADLRHPVAIIEVSLNNLSNPPALESEKEIFTQLGEATQSINENIRSVLDYLHLKLKDGVVETEGKVALEILGHFSHALRENSALLMGFVSVGQQVNLSEDEFKHNMEAIKQHAKPIVKVFKVLHENWRMWLETETFDWHAS